MKRGCGWFVTIGLAGLLLAVAVSTGAQQNADLEQGLKPYGSYQGGNLDSVSLTNGNLMLHIPLISYPQRGGKLTLGFYLKYNNKGWQGQRVWANGQWNYIIYWHGAGVEVARDQDILTNQTIYTGTDIEGSKYIAHLYNAYTSDGSSHMLESVTNTSYFESVDTTGIRVIGTAGNANSIAVDRNGIRFTQTGALTEPSQMEDTNGNLITYSSSTTSWTDTLGRVITGTVPIAPGTAYGKNPSPGSVLPGVPSTNLAPCPSGSTEARLWNLPGPSGGTSTITFCYMNVTVTSQFNLPPWIDQSAPDAFMNAVILPNGTSWQFSYDSWGDLSQVTFPTGGSLSYTWANSGSCNSQGPGSRSVATRTLNANDGTGGHTWNYQRVGFNVTVTDPLGNDTTHASGDPTGGCSLYVMSSSFYQGSHISGSLIKSTFNSYTGIDTPRDIYTHNPMGINVVPTSETTIWANGKTAQRVPQYDSGNTFTFNDRYDDTITNYPLVYGSVTQETQSDYGANSPSCIPNCQPGPVLHKAVSQYMWTQDSTYLGANLLDLPYSVQTFEDGGSTQASYAQYTYGDTVQSSGVTKQRNSTPSAPHRGNLLSTAHWLNGSATSTTNCPYSVSNGNITSTSTYYDTGMVYQSTDPCQHTTTYTYSSSYYGAYVTQTQSPDTNSPNLAHHIISGTYDFNTGLLTTFTDENSNTSTYTYDNMFRISTAVFPTQPEGTGQTNFYYPDANTVERKQLVSGSVWTDLYVRFDGVGRESRRITANGEASPWDQADTCYDARGHVAFASYPYQGNGFSTAQRCSGLGDSFTYDPLGRKTVVTHSDTTQINYSYAGPTTSVTDEGNGNGSTHVQRISQLDGLGRLINVCEISANAQQGVSPAPCNLDISGTGFLTSYAYTFDASTSNVKVTATQGSLNPRISTTNSLGWLIAAQNPESGTLTYGYDEDGNVITRTAPAPNQTGSGTVTATITYDPLHRPRTKTYSDNTTPSVTINYDETSVLGRTLSNTKGRETSAYMTTVVSPIGTQAAEVFSYDVMGRTRDNSQCTPQNCGPGTVFPMTYTYDLAGDMLTGTNGLGTTLSYAYNQAARFTGITSSLSDPNHPGTLLSGVHYNAFGGDTSVTLGNSVAETAGYAPRGWLQSLSATLNSTTLYSFSLGFAPNGDVTTGNDSVNGNWNYAYDEFNRLCASNNGGQSPLTCTSSNNTGSQAFTYGYDRYGNRWNQTVTAGTGPAPGYGFDVNNRIVAGYGVSYDAAGNVTNDGTHRYTYDAENRIICVDGVANPTCISTAPTVYVYDAAGDRVRKTTGGTSVDYLYDLADHVVTEVSAVGGWNRGEVFAGGHHIATYAGGASGTITFTHADWLGTERARTNTTGTVIETCINLPFGDGQSCSGSGGDPSPLHFTGKQRDTESGNDDFGARYFNSGMGRWLTPDWSAKPAGTPYSDPAIPQTLNLYAYIGNNPVSHTDPDGHGSDDLDDGGKVGMKQNNGEIIYTANKTVQDTLNKQEAQKEAAQTLQKAQNTSQTQQQSQSDQKSSTQNNSPTSNICSEDGPHIVRDAAVKALSSLNPGQDETKNVTPRDGNFAQVADPSKIDTKTWTNAATVHGTSKESPTIPGQSTFVVKLYNDPKRGNIVAVVYPNSNPMHGLGIIPFALGSTRVNVPAARAYMGCQ